MLVSKTIKDSWLIEQTTELGELIIEEGASIIAPEGNFVNLTVNGIGRQIKPGAYKGNVVLTVARNYHMPPHGLMRIPGRSYEFRDAIVVENGRLVPEKGVPDIVCGGEVSDKYTDGISIASEEESFNGILVTGDSEYTIRNSSFDLDGFGANDFIGVGAGVTAIDNARVTIDNCRFTMAGVTRCAIHVGGDSVVRANNCRIENHSPDNPEWMGEFSWGIGVTGSNRLVQLCDNGTVYYTNCYMKTNGWGVASIDGCDDSVKMYLKDCYMELSGPRAHGYGAFCIGDKNVTDFDHCRVHVNGYPLMVRGMEGIAKAAFRNSCEVTGNRFAVFCIGDNQTRVEMKDSSFITGKSTFAVKGSTSIFNVDNCILKPGNGVLLQLQDNDEVGMYFDAFILPVGKTDVYTPGRDLSAAVPGEDVIMNFSNMELKGNFFNSTTDLHAEKDGIKGGARSHNTFGGMFNPENFAPPPAEDGSHDPRQDDGYDYDAAMRGAKNLGLFMKNVRLEGIISSAREKHKDGLSIIDESTRLELTNVTQTAAPAINNGVVVDLDRDCTWIVPDTCYITGLSFEHGTTLKSTEGRMLSMLVDGVDAPLVPGTYKGHITLVVV